MWTFYTPDLDCKVAVSKEGRHFGWRILADDGVLHDEIATVPDDVIAQVDIEGLITNGYWQVMA